MAYQRLWSDQNPDDEKKNDQGAPSLMTPLSGAPSKQGQALSGTNGGGQLNLAGVSNAPMSGPTPAQNVGTGFINYSQLWNANADKAAGMANQVAAGVEKQGQSAVGQLNDLKNSTLVGNQAKREEGQSQMTAGEAQPFYNQQARDMMGQPGFQGVAKSVSEAQSAANALGTPGGLQATVQDKWGTNDGGARLDAALTGSAGSQKFGELKSKYGSLWNQLQGANDAVGADYQANAQIDPNHRVIPDGYTSDVAPQGMTFTSRDSGTNINHDSGGISNNDLQAAIDAALARNDDQEYMELMDEKDRRKADGSWTQIKAYGNTAKDAGF